MRVHAGVGEKLAGSHPDGGKLRRSELTLIGICLVLACFIRGSGRETRRRRNSALGWQPRPALTGTLKQTPLWLCQRKASTGGAHVSIHGVRATLTTPLIAAPSGRSRPLLSFSAAPWDPTSRAVSGRLRIGLFTLEVSFWVGGTLIPVPSGTSSVPPPFLPQVPSAPGSLLGSRVRMRLRYDSSEDTRLSLDADARGHAGVPPPGFRALFPVLGRTESPQGRTGVRSRMAHSQVPRTQKAAVPTDGSAVSLVIRPVRGHIGSQGGATAWAEYNGTAPSPAILKLLRQNHLRVFQSASPKFSPGPYGRGEHERGQRACCFERWRQKRTALLSNETPRSCQRFLLTLTRAQDLSLPLVRTNTMWVL